MSKILEKIVKIDLLKYIMKESFFYQVIYHRQFSYYSRLN